MSPCFAAILCALGAPIISSLKATLIAQIVVLNGQVASLTATLAILDIQLLPLTVARNLAIQARDTIRSAGDLVPVAIMADCADIGDMMGIIDESTEEALAAINLKINQVNRSLSFKAEIEARIDQLNAYVARINDMILGLEVCGQ